LRPDLSRRHPGAGHRPEGVGCVPRAPTQPCPITGQIAFRRQQGTSARSRSPAGVVRTADQHVARRGIRCTARTPRAGRVSRSS
jgi:hypothetical protein